MSLRPRRHNEAMDGHDAIVVGSGPNGLAAAITLAEAGLSTLVVEASSEIGGGARSAQLTLPGFVHDICSAVHPLAVASPFFRKIGLESRVKWILPHSPLAHPLPRGDAVVLNSSVKETAAQFGEDARAYDSLFRPLAERCDALLEDALKPVLHFPEHPWLLARLGLRGIAPAEKLARRIFKNEKSRAFFAGLASHASHGLDEMFSAAFGLILGMLGHAVGWPFPEGGAGQISIALADYFKSLGGKIETGRKIGNLRELPRAKIVMLDVGPRQLLQIAGNRLPQSYRNRLREFRHGPGVFKVDYALNAPIPWKNEACRQAGTIHLGGTFQEICEARRQVLAGIHPEKPFILLSQPTLFDSTRAPANRHVAWAYCHVPQRSAYDMSERMEKQIARFAPGFRDCVIARRVAATAYLENHNANLEGGSIDGGTTTLWQTIARPVLGPTPYRTPLRGVYLCSASTPPGGGVHGMCGHLAATLALKDTGVK